jgi:hypothetical protein
MSSKGFGFPYKVQSHLGYTKGMSHFKNIHKTLFWLTMMLIDSFILVNLFFHLIFIFFVIVFDLDDLNMSLNVLEHVLRMLSHYGILLKRKQRE